MVEFDRMADAGAWESRDVLVEFLGEQLLRGRLALVLGAGVSFGFGLPTWPDLVAALEHSCGVVTPAGLSLEQRAEVVLTKGCANDGLKFGSLVRKAMYRDYTLDFTNLMKSELLRALAAMMMASARGHVSKVVTFNFDDLLEQFLRLHGFVASSVARLPAWERRSDVTVYHPHGLLSAVEARPVTKIVLASLQYDEVVGHSADAWRRTMLDIFSSHTCLFIGLSGNDTNLGNVLTEVKGHHVSHGKHPYWGVRFSRHDDPLETAWQNRGVAPHRVEAYAEIPPLLLSICQRAAEMSSPGDVV